MASTPNSSFALRCLILAAVVLLVFGRAARHEFVLWDDTSTLQYNKLLNPPSVDTLSTYWTTAPEGLYVPFTRTLWTAIAVVARGPDEQGNPALVPGVFHSLNVLLHVGAAILAFALNRRLVRNDNAALLGAAIFAMHPLQVETVAWASGTKDVLCWTLGLGALLLYLKNAETSTEVQTETRRTGAFMAATLLFILACLSKPTAVVLVLAAAAIDLLHVRRPWRRVVSTLLPWVVLAVGFSVIARIVQDVNEVPFVPLWQRPFVAGDALMFDLWKLVWPFKLCVDYGRTPQVVMAMPGVWFHGLVPLALLAAAIVFRKRFPLGLLGALFFVIGVAPLLGFLPFQMQYYSTPADHYLYFSMLGVGLIVAGMVSCVPNCKATCVGVAIAIALAVRTFFQLGTWHDSYTLFKHTVAVNPQSFVGWRNLASAASHLKQYDEELADRIIGVKVRPDYVEGRMLLGRSLLRFNRDDEAAREFDTALQYAKKRPNSTPEEMAKALAFIATLYQDAGRVPQAIVVLEQAMKLNPDDVDLRERHDRLVDALNQYRAAHEKQGMSPTH